MQLLFWAGGTSLATQPGGNLITKMVYTVVSQDVFIAWLILAPPICKERAPPSPVLKPPLDWKTAAVRQHLASLGQAEAGSKGKQRLSEAAEGLQLDREQNLAKTLERVTLILKRVIKKKKKETL